MTRHRIDRRQLLKLLPAGAAVLAAPAVAGSTTDRGALKARLREARGRPVLDRSQLDEPIVIDRLEMLRRDGQYFVRATCTEGASGWALCNPGRMPSAFAIFPNRIAPYLVGKDARDLDTLVDDVLLYRSSYKWQGLPYWSALARTELAILDLIGQRSGLPAHALLGGKVRDSIGVYYANGDRKHSADWVVDRLKASVAESGARAVKFKLGARLRTTAASTARDLELVPKVRDAFGEEMTIYADANGSYDVPEAIRIGRLMEEYDYGFFEEPVRFDYLEETREVADALSIPIAGGEQESSLWRFEWLIANAAVQIVQPDLIYFGGLLRSMRVAAMAREAGIDIVPHISPMGLGALYMTHFACAVGNTTDFQEYKGDPDDVPYEIVGTGERFRAKDGRLTVPDAPGFGVRFDPDYLRGLEPVPT